MTLHVALIVFVNETWLLRDGFNFERLETLSVSVISLLLINLLGYTFYHYFHIVLFFSYFALKM